MNTCFVKVLRIAAIAVTAVVVMCSPAGAQSSLSSMRAQYLHGSSQRGAQSNSDTYLNPLLGSPPDYNATYSSDDDTAGSNRGHASAYGDQARNAKPSQSMRMTSLYGAPQDYGDSYSAHFESQPRKTDEAHQTKGFGLAAMEGLSLPGSGGRGGISPGKLTSRRSSELGKIGQPGNGSVSGSSVAGFEEDLAARQDSGVGGNAAAKLYRAPW
ncbi:exported protein of unknown function [Paraburkholderia dioscoreae]|uniref:Uncharacterized protein n=1 Tax=Paraburkholderia dioscoreae TaxID=2604047 RepID=A0A5Q4ZKB7_9BURK|nr:exported protein of unknown function [Paraburkholderia dioscoreae]